MQTQPRFPPPFVFVFEESCLPPPGPEIYSSFVRSFVCYAPLSRSLSFCFPFGSSVVCSLSSPSLLFVIPRRPNTQLFFGIPPFVTGTSTSTVQRIYCGFPNIRILASDQSYGGIAPAYGIWHRIASSLLTSHPVPDLTAGRTYSILTPTRPRHWLVWIYVRSHWPKAGFIQRST